MFVAHFVFAIDYWGYDFKLIKLHLPKYLLVLDWKLSEVSVEPPNSYFFHNKFKTSLLSVRNWHRLSKHQVSFSKLLLTLVHNLLIYSNKVEMYKSCICIDVLLLTKLNIYIVSRIIYTI